MGKRRSKKNRTKKNRANANISGGVSVPISKSCNEGRSSPNGPPAPLDHDEINDKDQQTSSQKETLRSWISSDANCDIDRDEDPSSDQKKKGQSLFSADDSLLVDGNNDQPSGSDTKRRSWVSADASLDVSRHSTGGGGIDALRDVVAIDPESVDFQPLLLSETGAVLSYHARRSSVRDEETRIKPAPVESGGGGLLRPLLNLAKAVAQELAAKVHYTDQCLRACLLRPVATAFSSEDPSISSSFGVCVVFFLAVSMVSLVFSESASRFSLKDPISTQMLRRNNILSEPASENVVEDMVALDPVIENNLSNVEDQLRITDTAVFWHVPRSMGTTMKHIMGMCMGRTITTDIGGQEGHAMDETLQIIAKPFGNFVNVDTTTPLGLERAKSLGLAQSNMADIIFTPYVHEAARTIFTPTHRGRFITVLRDPIDRYLSLFYFLRMKNKKVKEMSLKDFAEGYGENWMVRSLANQMSGKLEEKHLEIAKEILRKKFLVGLLEEKTETLRRIEAYFMWKFPSPVSQTCKNNMMYFEWNSKNNHPPVETVDEKIVEVLRHRNSLDVRLYEYGKELFVQQAALFSGSDDANENTER